MLGPRKAVVIVKTEREKIIYLIYLACIKLQSFLLLFYFLDSLAMREHLQSGRTELSNYSKYRSVFRVYLISAPECMHNRIGTD